MKAWLSILGQALRRVGRRAAVVVVDGFAGRGRYASGAPGSPLILRDIAGSVVQNGKIDEVEIFFVERDRDNHAALSIELETSPPPRGVRQQAPARAEFAQAGRRIIELVERRPRPSFWFIDPFGFSGMPLTLIHDILQLPQSEVFVTFMSRDINRFLDQPNHQAALAELLGLDGADLADAVSEVASSDKREHSLRDLYVRCLHEGAKARFVWTFRVAEESAQDTVYYLVHASNHPKAFREMKDATYKESSGTFAFLGKDDHASTGQLSLPNFDTDTEIFQKNLLLKFSGQTITYEELLNEAYPDSDFHMFIDPDFRRALNELANRGTITKTPTTSKTQRGLSGNDLLHFPSID